MRLWVGGGDRRVADTPRVRSMDATHSSVRQDPRRWVGDEKLAATAIAQLHTAVTASADSSRHIGSRQLLVIKPYFFA